MSQAYGAGDTFQPLAGPILWITGFVLALANFMVVLDTTIANVSVPNIAGGLAVSPSQGAWVVTSYSVAEAITVPLSGWLVQRFGAVRVFVTAMIGFGLFSMACGGAPSLAILVMCRVGQGLCGGPMMPLSQALMRRIFPAHLQAMATGFWSMTTVVGPLMGPLLGGAICDTIGWPWVFFINLPFAFGGAYFARRLLAKAETPTLRVPVDVVGLMLLIAWVGALQIMFDKGRELDWFESPFIIVLAVIAAVGFAAFLIWELTDKHPIVDLRVFRHRGFAAISAVMSIGFGTFFSTIVLLPLWLQTSMGYTAAWAGRVMALQGVFAVIMSPVAARLTTVFDPRYLLMTGILIMAAATLWRAGATTDANYWSLAMPQLLLGLGVPFFFVPAMTLALGSVEPREVASAAGILNFTRTTAGAFGASMIITAWTNDTTSRHAELAGVLNTPQASIDGMKAMGMTGAQSLGAFDRLVQGQAVMLSTDGLFIACALVFVCAACVVWLAPRPGAVAVPTDAH